MIDVTTTLAVISWKKEAYRIMIADKIKNARTILYYITNFVFTNRFGMPHNPAAVNRAIKRIADTHNSEEEVAAKKEKREPIMIPRFSRHIFRHTFASRFCENETNIKVIQEVMGHADVSTTMNIYAEANPDVTKSVIEKLSKNMDIF